MVPGPVLNIYAYVPLHKVQLLRGSRAPSKKSRLGENATGGEEEREVVEKRDDTM